jgi:hypothetical protein
MGATNPAFDGWVFEADFFFQCKRAAEMKTQLTLKGEPGPDLEPRSFFNFNHDDMLGKAHSLSASCNEPLSNNAQNQLKQQVQSDLLMMVNRRCKPTKWNQGGYDGFDVSSDAVSKKITIDFFQVTRGASHPLNLKCFVEVVQLFIDAGFVVCGCEIYFVIPEDQTTTISKVTPYGNLFQTPFGWVSWTEKEKIRVVTMRKTTSVPVGTP